MPKRPWDNFHFIEFNEIIKGKTKQDAELAFATHTLLEIPDQYQYVRDYLYLNLWQKMYKSLGEENGITRMPK